jgi:hypothetical protein
VGARSAAAEQVLLVLAIAVLKAPGGPVMAAVSICARAECLDRYWPLYVRTLRDMSAAATTQLEEAAPPAAELRPQVAEASRVTAARPLAGLSAADSVATLTWR